MKIKEFQHKPVKPDTYEASMALNQLMRIGKHAVKLHNMIDDAAEMESWVAKKIDLAGDYVKKVYNYTEGEKAGLYDDGGMSEMKKMPKGTGTMQGIKEDQTTIDVKAILDKHGIKSTNDIEYGSDAFSDLFDYFSSDPDEMPYGVQKARTGMPDEWIADRLIDLGLLKEDAPFGSGMDLVRMAVLRKFISAEEYMAYAKELKAAAEETAEHYDDWPDGEGFGSSDGNFAIKDMMSAAGYKFDEQDRSGSFIVTKMPDKLEKMGIKNARMRNAVATEDAGDQEKMQGLLQWFQNKYDTYRKDFINDQIENGIRGSQLEQAVENNDELVELENIIDALKSGSMKDAIEEINNAKYEFSGIPGDGDDFMQVIEKLGIPKDTFYFTKDESLEARLEAKLSENTDKQAMAKEIAKMYDDAYEYINDSSGNPSDIESDYKFGYNDDDSMEAEDLAAAFRQDYDRGMALQKQLQAQRQKEGRGGDWDPFNPESMYHAELKALMSKAKGESVSEDAGEGHMSKSTLYHTAKYAIALMDMIKPGDDLEGWVQSKLNKAADYLQGVYNYEEYQKLNPYREELDASLMQKHAKVVQKNIDEILSKETKLDDIDTKPGMMRILAKRVNEVEKEIAKETRKKTNEDGHTDVPSAIRNCETIIEDAMQMKQKLQTMEGELPSWMTQMIAVAASDLNDARDYLLNPTTESGILYRAGVKKYGKKGMRAIQSAAGKGASHQEIGKIKDKHLKDEEDLDESIKDWAKNLAAAGVIVGAVAGMGSIQNAIDNTVPAVKAMNTAYEMAVDSGNSELAKNIKNDISAVKVRLDSGKDLDFVKAMQDKYSKFIQTEGLTYESQLALALNQRLK